MRAGEAFTESDKDVVGTFVMTVLDRRERDGVLRAETKRDVARFLLANIHEISSQTEALAFLDRLAGKWQFFDEYLPALSEFLEW